jgi:hypothetical protein
MNANQTARISAAAEQLIRALSAFDAELETLGAEAPGVAALRLAIGAALARVAEEVPVRDAGGRDFRRAIH